MHISIANHLCNEISALILFSSDFKIVTLLRNFIIMLIKIKLHKIDKPQLISHKSSTLI